MSYKRLSTHKVKLCLQTTTHHPLRVGTGFPVVVVLTSYVDDTAQEPLERAFAHVAVHDLVKLLHPAQSPSRQVAPERLGVLQTLLINGAVVLRDGGQLQRIAH